MFQFDLIGGKCFDTLRVYANGWYNKCIHPEQYAEAALKLLEKDMMHLNLTFGIDIDGVWRYPSRISLQIERSLLMKGLKQLEGYWEDVDILIEVHGNL